MKIPYESPDMEIICFENEDVIIQSTRRVSPESIIVPDCAEDSD